MTGTGIRGKTERCLAHLFDNTTEDVRTSLTTFCGVHEQTTRRWRAKRSDPKGEELLKVRHFLQMRGYRLIEHEELDTAAGALGLAFVFNVATIEEIAAALDFTGDNPRSSTLAYLLGRRGLSEERTLKAHGYAQQLREQTLKKQAQFLNGHAPTSTPPKEVVAPAHAPGTIMMLAPSGQTVTVEGRKGTLLAATAHSISALIPMADYLLSDECTEEDRQKLHQLVGDDRVFKLTVRLKRLCSETAREKFTS